MHPHDTTGADAPEAASPDLPLSRDDFIALFRLDERDLADFLGLAIREDGVYVIQLPDSLPITPEERAAWPHHPLGDPFKPLFTFPCTEAQALWLEEWRGVSGYIDREDLEQWRAKKAAEIAKYRKECGLSSGATGPQEAALRPETALQARTAPQRQDRQARLEALRAFLDEVLSRASAAGEQWARGALPCRKQHVFEVFQERYRAARYITLATFEKDLKNVGAGFRAGVWSQFRPNPLWALFE
jgi:hypothetical protein